MDFGAAFDNPDFDCGCGGWGTVSRRRGRSPLRGTRISFLNPIRDGAVLPILHLNGLQDREPYDSGAHS